jgi:cell wall-associated NlpC family hydrolase
LRRIPRAALSVLVTGLLAGTALAVAPSQPAAAAVPAMDNTKSGYWVATSSGDVWKFGNAPHYGSMKGRGLAKPIVGISPTNSKNGYWMVASDGGIFSFGDADFHGSTGNIRLNKPVVGMTTTKSGNGYWMVASDGGIFSFGDAKFHGSTGSINLNKPIVGMARTPSGNGYWLVASDGGVFSFGDAKFHGSTGSINLAKPITTMTATSTGNGYWMVASDGGIFSFGDAKFHGSAGGSGENTYSRMIRTSDNNGYWLVRNGGDVLAYGSAKATTVRPRFGMMFANTGAGSRAVEYAMDKLGKSYVWGGNGPNGYDCSGLTSQAWLSAGRSIPRVANDQSAFGQRVNIDNLRPGDLLYWGPDRSNTRSINHVAMYVGGGWAINAGGTGTGVNVRSVPQTAGWMFNFGTRPAS